MQHSKLKTTGNIICIFIYLRGLYIGKYPSPGGISADVIWGENMKRGREKQGNVKEKGRKGKEKGRKGKENEKKGSKKIK